MCFLFLFLATENVIKDVIKTDFNDYEKAVIVTSDGDFQCLVRYLAEKGKLERVLGLNRVKCSALLKRAAGARIDFLEDARKKIECQKR